MLTQKQLSQLEKYAIPPQMWHAWVPDKLTASFAHVPNGGACFGHHPEIGWFALEKAPGAESPRKLKFAENQAGATMLPDVSADFENLVEKRWGTYYAPPSPVNGPGTPMAFDKKAAA